MKAKQSTFAPRSEPGLYKLAFASRLETAEAFQDWVCKEVLPSIRKTGSYDIQTLKNELALRDKSHSTYIIFLIIPKKHDYIKESTKNSI